MNKEFQAENLLTRLSRIPITRSIVGVIALLSLVWLAEAFDIGVLGPVLTSLHTHWQLDNTQMGWLSVISTIGVVIGMAPAGLLAGKFGRRKVVLFGIALFAVVTLVGALVNDFGQLLCIRLVAGLGEGAVLPMPYLFLSEFVHNRRRAVSVGYSNGILTAAYLIPNLASSWALNTFSADISWRVPFLLGGIPLLMLIPLFLWLPESPRYLLQKGQFNKVQTLVERLEKEANLPHDTKLHDVRIQTARRDEKDTHHIFAQLRKPPYLQRTIFVIAQLTAALLLFYVLQVYGPTLLVARGMDESHAILYAGLMMLSAGIGSLVQGYLAEKFGRKRVLCMYVILSTIGCLLFATHISVGIAILAAFLASFFGLGIFPVSKLCVAEQYPNSLRGEGVYISEMTARALSGCVTLFFIPTLIAHIGPDRLFIGIAAVFIILAMPFIIWGRETANMSVEEAGTRLTQRQLDRVVGAAYSTK
ncbi:MFS transporter [Alicyclobacillus fodiniaquatilis]|uniref:MFS transporter n=1 Tax=Alicyclobacillus fodiniaquatilis TaxID=1661150 RepID=A0ABW4JDH9_9BACL